MLRPHPDLEQDELQRMLREQFGVTGRPEFQPLGEDSWCYRVGDLWVSVRRDLRGHNPAAYQAAHRLRQGGLSFVLAPVPGADGAVTHTVTGCPVVVFPFALARPLDPAADPPSFVDRAIEQLSQVHASDPGVALPAEDYHLPFGQALGQVIEAAAARDRKNGPYSGRLHRLIRAHRADLAAVHAEAASLAATCASAAEPAVLTHGEPRAQNLLRAGDALLIGDWGDARWGPPERDWFHVLGTLGAAPACRPEFLKFYRVRWLLGEIFEYATIFSSAHDGDAQDHAMWSRLTEYLAEP